MELYKNRRKKLATYMPDSALIIGAVPPAIRNSDVTHPFRQDSSIYYFTGFEEEESIFVFRPGRSPESVLFVRPKDPVAELWDGVRYGEEKAKEHFQLDACYSIYDLEEKLEELLLPVEKVYYQFNKNPELDQSVHRVLESGRRSRGRTGLGIAPIFDANELIGELRLFKDETELSHLKRASEISCEAHREAMKYTGPGVNERQVEAVMNFVFANRGANNIAYGPIVASGNNATVLHYNSNNLDCGEFDLLLIDAGCEYSYYAADITRTFPVNGMFTSAQKDFYQAVLEAQNTVIKMCKPGVLYKDLHQKCIEVLSGAIADLGLIKESKDTIMNEKLFFKYFPHGTGHWLGLDVHDAGAYLIDGESRPLEKGMCFTVEPGLYVPKDDLQAPEAFRGMGVRIEDNIFITDKGHLNLTEAAPKEVSDIESLMKEESLFKKF